jgi:hypothetical protein
MRRAELVSGLVVAVLGALALQMALNMAMFSQSHAPGPGFFPRVLSVLLLVLGLLLAASSLPRTKSKPVSEQAGSADLVNPAGPAGGARTELRRQARAGLVWLCFAVAVALLALLGFVPTMAALVFVLIFAVEGRHTWWSLLVAAAIPVAASFLFVDLLSIPLPVGLLSHAPLGI